MKKPFILLLTSIAHLQLAFCGETHGVVRNNRGQDCYTFHEYRSNDLIEYDKYKQQQKGAAALGYLIGAGIGLGVKKAIVAIRDENIGKILKGYKFNEHHKYMSRLSESSKIKNKHKSPLISLFNSYRAYREKLDADFSKKIDAFHKPMIPENTKNIDLLQTPYTKNQAIEFWIYQHYSKKNEASLLLDVIYEYKTDRINSDREFNEIYFNILNS